MNASDVLLQNVERIMKVRGETWDDVLPRLGGGKGRSVQWLSSLRTGQRGKYLRYLDELSEALGVEPAALFGCSGHPAQVNGSAGGAAETQPLQPKPREADRSDRESNHAEGIALLKGLPDYYLFLSLIGVWDKLQTRAARSRFVSEALRYADDVEAGRDATGTLGKR